MHSSTTSPFAFETDEPWTVWEQKHDLYMLKDEREGKQNNVGALINSVSLSEGRPMPAAQIHRTQYNLVLNRMKQACINTGNFSTWKS